MKKYIITYCFTLFACATFAQKQTNTWYFGSRVGLDFNQLPPKPLYNGALTCIEGSSTISDNNGRLLFYTNGSSIMNRQHVLMKNGSPISGHPSSTNGAVIMPLPGNDSIYYLFTVGAANEELQQFLYTIVNIKGDGGLGEVDINSRNVIIEERSFEKLAAIKHCNNRDVWIIIHKWNSDEYHAYLLTASGLNTTPVISHSGLVVNGDELNALGTLKFSAKGSKLAAVHSYGNNAVELMDFDNTTGVLSNPITFYPNATAPDPTFKGAYGAEFSPNGRLLYISSNNSLVQASVLYQFDITSHNPATILASKQIIHQNPDFVLGALQTGPDLKIYASMWKDSALSVIEDPDVYGAGCNFNFNKIYIGPVAAGQLHLGLPTFMQSYFDTTSNPYDFSRLPGSCLDRNVTFKINRLSGIDSVKWDFGDTQKSQALQPTHMYAAPGFYDVNLIVYKVDCSGLNDTINRRIWIAASDKFLGNDTSSCNAFKMEIGINDIFGVNYVWNTGSNSNKITIAGFGEYWLELEQNSCKLRDSIKVTETPKPVVNLGVDTIICRYKPVVLNTGFATYDTYLWSTGETTPSISVNEVGTYYITVTKNLCEASDTVKVTPGDCDVYLPSAFTPNNDNLNETFGVVDNVALQYYSMQIYSKWGQLIFSSSDVTKKWDGTFKGKKMPAGSYLWMLNYVNRRGRAFYEQGMVQLIR